MKVAPIDDPSKATVIIDDHVTYIEIAMDHGPGTGGAATSSIGDDGTQSVCFRWGGIPSAFKALNPFERLGGPAGHIQALHGIGRNAQFYSNCMWEGMERAEESGQRFGQCHPGGMVESPPAGGSAWNQAIAGKVIRILGFWHPDELRRRYRQGEAASNRR